MPKNYGTLFVFPTGASMNPRYPAASEFYNPAQTAYVLFKTSEARTRPTRVVTSFGASGMNVGDTVDLYHDQTRKFLGRYEVVGVHDFSNGLVDGDVPMKMLKHAVVK